MILISHRDTPITGKPEVVRGQRAHVVHSTTWMLFSDFAKCIPDACVLGGSHVCSTNCSQCDICDWSSLFLYLSICLLFPLLSFETNNFRQWFFACVCVVAITCMGLKFNVTVHTQRSRSLCVCAARMYAVACCGCCLVAVPWMPATLEKHATIGSRHGCSTARVCLACLRGQ